MDHNHMSAHSMQQCIDVCTNCRAICLETIDYCLKKGGAHAAADHISTLMDCVDSCEVCTRFMLRGSARHVETCRMCAAVCAACVASCENFPDDAQMKRCADACRDCAKECQAMAS